MAKEEISLALPDDVPQIIALCYKAFFESGLSHLIKEDFDKSVKFVTEAVFNDVVLVKRNKENPKMLDGLFGFKSDTTWFSSQPCLTSFMFYIKPEFRRFSLAKDFLNASKECAIINNLPIVFDLFAQKDVKKKFKLLKYMGFMDCGSHFVYFPSEGKINV